MSVMNFDYTGAVQTATLQAGTYLLECWGAQGGDSVSESGGNGGYSKGTLSLTSEKQIFVYVGGAGTHSTTNYSFVAGGFNGGGAAGSQKGGSGGGGSDIRIGQDSLYARVIVAGGGGGAWGRSDLVGGVGGGTNGGKGTGYSNNDATASGKGGTPTAGGAGGTYVGSESGNDGIFGTGGDAVQTVSSYNSSAGGGGGWYGGGGTTYRNKKSYSYQGGGGAGGGSGFVWQGENAPSGYLLGSEYYLTDAQTIAGSESFTSPTGTSETGHTGNGYVRITSLKPNPPTNLTETHDYFSATLKWSAAPGASGYKVYINDTLKATISSTTYIVDGLDAETQYTAEVVAYASNGDSHPAEITFQTASANFRQTAKKYREITLAWDSSARASGYRIYRDGTLIATTTSTTCTDSGLYPSESHTYQIKAYNGSNQGLSGTVIGKTEEGAYAQKPVFHSIAIVPNPTTINTQITITVNVTDEFIIFEPEKFYSGELYSNEV